MAPSPDPAGGWRALPQRVRRWLSGAAPAGAGPEAMVSFRCNLCAARCRVASRLIGRETPSCHRCGSTVRQRAVVRLLTTELFGRDLSLPDLPARGDIVGIGLSDAASYAGPLARRLAYVNTCFDGEPRLDIAAVPEERVSSCDFLVASDVFEHVAPPVSRAFVNARRILKPGGLLIFTVPFTLGEETVEHFPELHDYRLLETPQGRVLENRTADGRTQVFTGLRFHGGAGATLEMRIFSRAGLEREFARAGFSRLRFADEPCPGRGIAWAGPQSVPIVAHA